MLHATKGIVLRTVKYSETSIIVSIYTELYGLQSYLVNGVRTERKAPVKANMYQPTTMLDLIVYHNPHKNLQRIKDVKLFYTKGFQGADVIKYAIGIYMVELIQKAITETESNPALYDFFEQSFLYVLNEREKQLAGFPVAFTLRFAEHLGFGIQNNYSEETPLFSLQNGHFTSENDSVLSHKADREHSFMLSEILKEQHAHLNMTGAKRLELLNICIQYLRLHIPHLSELKSVSVLHEILN